MGYLYLLLTYFVNIGELKRLRTVDVMSVKSEQQFERLSRHGRHHVVVEQRTQLLIQSADDCRRVLLRYEVSTHRVQQVHVNLRVRIHIHRCRCYCYRSSVVWAACLYTRS